MMRRGLVIGSRAWIDTAIIGDALATVWGGGTAGRGVRCLPHRRRRDRRDDLDLDIRPARRAVCRSPIPKPVGRGARGCARVRGAAHAAPPRSADHLSPVPDHGRLPGLTDRTPSAGWRGTGRRGLPGQRDHRWAAGTQQACRHGSARDHEEAACAHRVTPTLPPTPDRAAGSTRMDRMPGGLAPAASGLPPAGR